MVCIFSKTSPGYHVYSGLKGGDKGENKETSKAYINPGERGWWFRQE